MQINIIRSTFILSSILTGFFGLLVNYVEPYLPTLISRTYRYGKYSVNTYQPIVARVEVPKRWFKHFYVFAVPVSNYVLYLVICKYLWRDNISKNIIFILNMCLGSFRQPLVSSEATFVAVLLLTLHIWKRFYETQCISIFSGKMMNISHYLIGFYHYMGTIISIIGESEGFVEGTEGNFFWTRITYLQLLCSAVFILSSYAQLRANIILSNLRKNKDGKINTAAYKIPHGGLFEYVSGALQFTEIVVYIMLSIILWESTTYHFITIWVVVNQTCTAVLTHKWYLESFNSYPKSRKILIPYIF